MSIVSCGKTIVLAACAVLAGTLFAFAADYPNRPVHFVVGVAAGGGSDTLTRIVAQKLSEKWGQPVVVENQGGASGIVATEAVSRAAPDGYTILWVSTSHVVNPSLNKLSYDPIKSFAPITQVAYIPEVMLVSPSLGINTLQELMALAKSEPGKLNYGTPGIGTPAHLETETLSRLAGVKMVPVAFKSGGEVIPALLGGEVQMYFAAESTALPAIRAGTLKPLAVSANVRSLVLPDVPTVAEAMGIAHFEAAQTDWTGVLAPAGTSEDIVNKVNKDIVDVLNDPDVKQRLTSIGFVPVGNSPAQFTELMQNEIARWSSLLKDLGIH